MNKEKELLNEAKYQKTSKSLFYVGVGLIIIGITLFIVIFIPKITSTSKNNKEHLQQELNNLRPTLESRYANLKENGVIESSDYKNKDGYEMRLIDIALDPTYGKCEHSSIYSDNNVTREYCKIKGELYDIDHSFSNGGILFSLVPALMALMPCIAIGGMLILISKRRSIIAYTMQQTMPVAEEGLEKIAPTIGKAGASIAKEVAPVYGEIAKEIGKGIKEGMKNEDNDK